jgi:hypothetical protein
LHKEDKSVLNIKLIEDSYYINSVALSHPDLNKSKLNNLANISRLDCLCPTYDMLTRYKSDGDWNKYTEDYKNLLKKRIDRVKDWINELQSNHVYILCCWENTSFGAHCHREIIYNEFKKSKYTKDKLILIYRHGGYKKKQDDGYSTISGNYTIPMIQLDLGSPRGRNLVDRSDTLDIGAVQVQVPTFPRIPPSA